MGLPGLLPGTVYPLILNLLKDGFARIAAGIVNPLILNWLKDGFARIAGFGIIAFARPGFRWDLNRHSRVSGNPAPAEIRFCPAPLSGQDNPDYNNRILLKDTPGQLFAV